jgi:hypothetical protein
MPTTSAVPSADPSDLLFNAQKLDEVINGTAESFIDRRGVERLTLTGAIRLIGFEAPVAFASGLAITRSTQTVTNGGNTYHADPASLPFTTTSTFNGAQWRLVSNVTQADLVSYAVPLVGGAGTIEFAKLAAPVQGLINGALQKSGGDMTGLFKLFGNATDPLHPVPKQQAETLIADSALVSSSLSFSSLSLSATGLNASVSVSAGELMLRSATGAPRLVSGVSLVINTAASGANGLDAGTLAGSTWYAVWVIWNGSTTAGLISTSATSPAMPGGYTHKARVGWIRTDGTASKFPLGFTQRGRRVQYLVNLASNVPNFPQMASGSAGDTSAPAFATIAVGNFVPSTAGVIDVLTRIGNASSVIVAPNGQFGGVGSSANPAPLSLIVNATTYGGVIRGMMVLESSNLYWACVGGGVVCCVGWEDNL